MIRYLNAQAAAAAVEHDADLPRLSMPILQLM